MPPSLLTQRERAGDGTEATEAGVAAARDRAAPEGRTPDATLPATGAVPNARVGLSIAVALLFLGALPDAMVPPVLRAIVVERLGAPESFAHWFMSVNFVGAVAAVPLLMWLRRRVAPTTILIGAALADAAFLLGLHFTESLAVAMTLRTFEGVADLIVLAVLFDLVAKAGGARARGRRMGLGATTLLLGLGIGALVGGRFGARPESVFLVGVFTSTALAAIAFFGIRHLQRAVASCPVVDLMESIPAPSRRIWPVVCMMAGDRALAGVLTVTIPLLLVGRLGFTTVEIAWVIAVPLLLMALLAWPAGMLGDRIGNLQLRAIAGLAYAIALAALPAMSALGFGAALAVVAPLGIAAAALMSTTLALTARTGRGSVAMAAVHAGGNLGYFLGISGGGALLLLVGGLRPDAGAFALVVIVFALAHVAVTGMATLTLFRIPLTLPSRVG